MKAVISGLSHKSLWSPNSLPPAIPCSEPNHCHALGSGADPVKVLGSRKNRKKDFHTEHATSPGICGIFIRESCYNRSDLPTKAD